MQSCSLRRALHAAALLVVTTAVASSAMAQTQVKGFALERLYLSPPGGGWFVMDELDLYGGLHGAMGLTFGYARNPLRIGDGSRRLAVVSDEAAADVGAAVAYDRFRLCVNATTPIVVQGDSGTVGAYAFTGASLTPTSNPDPISDVRVGADVRLFGAPRSPFRIGVGAQLLIPNGKRSDYDTDGTFRGMFRALFAGDVRAFSYAAQLGVHVRPLDDAPTPGSPRGSELIFGVAAGARIPVGDRTGWSMVVGPEVFGATPVRDVFGSGGSAFEGLLSTRFEGPMAGGLSLRVKAGAGLGDRQLGAPESRVLAGVEIFGAGLRREAATQGDPR